MSKSQEQLLILTDFLACLTKVEAMRGANDCRRNLNCPPVYRVKDFNNCLTYIQNAEKAIANKDVRGFLAKILKAKGSKN